MLIDEHWSKLKKDASRKYLQQARPVHGGRCSKKLVNEPDTECEFVDGSYVKAHQHSAGASGADSQAIGKNRAGNTTKIYLAVDSHGSPVEFSRDSKKVELDHR
jgi:hypothetical protein